MPGCDLDTQASKLNARANAITEGTIGCGPNNDTVMHLLRNYAGCVERPDEEASWTARRPRS